MSKRRERAPAGRLLAIGAAVLAVAVTTVVLTSCGGDEPSDAEQVREALAELQRGFGAGDVDAVCAVLAAKPRYQLGTIGHDRRPTTCERDLRDYLAGLEQAALIAQRPPPSFKRMPRPRIVQVRVAGDAAVAVARLGGERLDIPFDREDGRWLLGDLFVVTGPVRRDLQ